MKCLKWIIFSLSPLCISANAGNIPVTSISDNYIGAGYAQDTEGGETYNIHKMDVSRSGTLLTVDIFTNFVGNNTKEIGFGDLFMSTNVSTHDSPWKPNSINDDWSSTDWNYAYTIEDWEGYDGDYDSRHRKTSGRGRLVSGFDSDDLRYGSGSRDGQVVALKQSTESFNPYKQYHSYDTNHWYGTKYDPSAQHWNAHWSNWTATNGKLTFSFDVSNTYLETANQIAFRWAMTCANDIIEGLVSIKDKDPTTPVPEPQTLLLMLLGIAGIAYRRKTNS